MELRAGEGESGQARLRREKSTPGEGDRVMGTRGSVWGRGLTL